MRNHFNSDKEFGQWIATHRLCVGNQQARNRLMHLAKFFSGGRDMGGICLTVAYEISAPVNSEKSEAVYNPFHHIDTTITTINPNTAYFFTTTCTQ